MTEDSKNRASGICEAFWSDLKNPEKVRKKGHIFDREKLRLSSGPTSGNCENRH